MRSRILIFSMVILTGMLFWKVYAAAPLMTVYKDPNCGCCSIWVEHLRKNGFEVKVQDAGNMVEIKRKLGVPTHLQSCHTGVVDGYTIEGHVPAAEIQRLLKERPNAKGLTVPGMPLGSPGMEAGGASERYSVLLFDANGKTSEFKVYPAK
jgi:hypothetical protein